MDRSATRLIRLFMGTVLGLLMASPAAADPRWPQIQELFSRHCTACHSGASPSLGLRLDSREGVLAGSSNGAVVRAGKPAESELIRRIRGDARPRMPLTGPPYLDETAIALVENWILAMDPARPESLSTDHTAQEMIAAAPAVEGPYQSVAAIFLPRCASCHSRNGRMGPAPEGFVVTGYAELLDARERAWIVPGQPLASEVVRRIHGLSLPRMPFDGPPYLDAEEAAVIESWIAAGAPDDEGHQAPLPVGARVRLGGTLTGQWLLDGLELKVGPRARIRETFRPGQRVEVRGRVESDGSIAAERIRSR